VSAAPDALEPETGSFAGVLERRNASEKPLASRAAYGSVRLVLLFTEAKQ